MTWFFIALIGPVLWAIVNHIDKYLLSDKFKGSNIGALMIFSTLFCGLVLPVLYIMNNRVFHMPLYDIVILVIIGIISVFAILPYMYALDEEDTSIIIPLFQLIPVWGYFFSYVLLGEKLNAVQMIGCLLVVGGSMIITLEVDEEEKIRFKKRIIGLMLISTVLFALYETLFKYIAMDQNFIAASFWEYTGVFLMGIVFFAFIKKYRKNFIRLIKTSGAEISALNITSEVLTIIGNIATNFALMLAPVVLILITSGVQPIFVLIISVVLTVFFPKLYKEHLSKKHMVQKLFSIAIMLVGAYFLLK